MSSFNTPVDLSIIIVNYNSKDVLTNCLKSIAENEYRFKYEVIVIDNGSDEKIDALEKKYSEVQFLHNKSNLGFATANNLGIRKAKGEYILLLNPDTIVNEKSFQPMIGYLKNHNDAAVVGCKIYNIDGEIERSTHSFPSLLKEFMHANEYLKSFIGYDTRIAEFIKKIFKTKSLDSYWDHNSIREVDHVTGACMMIKREAIDKVGLLDEAFFLYNEEVEWSYRFKQAGYKSIFVSDSSIIHLFGYSTKQCVQKQTANNLLVERYRGMFYFFQKHYGKIKLFLLKTIVAEAFTLRIIFSYIYSVFTTDEKSRIKKNERVYLKQILALSTAKNFDWRNRQ